MQKKRTATAATRGNVADDFDEPACGKKKEKDDNSDLKTLLSCSVAAAMLLPDLCQESKIQYLDEGIERGRSETGKASKKRRKDDEDERQLSTPTPSPTPLEHEPKPQPPPTPLTADDHAFFLAAESTLAAPGGSLSRACLLRWQRLRPRFAAERAAWWARAWAGAAASAGAAQSSPSPSPSPVLFHPRVAASYAALRSRGLARARGELPRLWRKVEGGGGAGTATATTTTTTLDLNSLLSSPSSSISPPPPPAPVPLRSPKGLKRLRHPLLPGGGGSTLLKFESEGGGGGGGGGGAAAAAVAPLASASALHRDAAALELADKQAGETSSPPLVVVASASALVALSGFALPSPVSRDPGWRLPVVVVVRKTKNPIAFIGDPLPPMGSGGESGYHEQFDEDARRALGRVARNAVVAAASSSSPDDGEGEGEGANPFFYDLWRAPDSNGDGRSVIVRWRADGAVCEEGDRGGEKEEVAAAGAAAAAGAPSSSSPSSSSSSSLPRPVSVAASPQFLGPLPEDAEEPAPYDAARLEAAAALRPWAEVVVARVFAGASGSASGGGGGSGNGNGNGNETTTATLPPPPLPRLLRVAPGPLPRPAAASRALDLAVGVAEACCRSLASAEREGEGGGENEEEDETFFLFDRAAGAAEGVLLRSVTPGSSSSSPAPAPALLTLPSENARKLPGVTYDLWASLESARKQQQPRIGPPPPAPRAWRPAPPLSAFQHVPHTPPPHRDTKKQRKKQKQQQNQKERERSSTDKVVRKKKQGGKKGRGKARELRRRRRQEAYLKRFPLAAEVRAPGDDFDAVFDAAAAVSDVGAFAAAAEEGL